MLRNLSPSVVRLLLACSLCLLATAFAVEAKIAWFGPATGPGSEIRAAKALPPDAPVLTDHGNSGVDQSLIGASVTLLACFAITSLVKLGLFSEFAPLSSRSSLNGYFPPLPLRAPPLRN